MMQGTRVSLRRMAAEDTDVVLRLRAEPGAHGQLFSDAPPSREAHLRWLGQLQARGDRHEFVIVDLESARIVGTIGLSHIDRRHRRAEYGVLVGEPDARGKGLAAEASRLLLQYAFGELGLHRVFLHVFLDNEPALRLYERLGFKTEGRLRQHVCKDGRFRDVVVMAILATEAP
jgi:UDP-4-amino-4,6-dideoxy-N-acetyl-beta-L-altrosamine N-acetyltransferase